FFFFFFFFSSRRRHTRFDCDWSSDVCSSDLVGTSNPFLLPTTLVRMVWLIQYEALDLRAPGQVPVGPRAQRSSGGLVVLRLAMRSEERRVGKECRSGWGREECKKKKRRQRRG